MATLSPYSLRYPVDLDAADGPTAFLNLASDITTALDNRGAGLVAWHQRTTDGTDTTTEKGVVRLDAPFSAARAFVVTTNLWVTSTAAATMELRVRYTTNGTTPTAASPLLIAAPYDIPAGKTVNVEASIPGTMGAAGTLKLLVTLVRLTGTAPIKLKASSTLPAVVIIEDTGPVKPFSGSDVEDPGTGGGGGTTPTFSNPGQALNIGTADGQNHFNVGIGRPAAHTDYEPSQIASGYSSDPEFIVTPSGTAVQFRVRMDAARTSANTKYPRCELREYAENGTDKAAWNGSTGTHYMKGTSRITHLPPIKPWVVFCQIHDASSDLIRVQTEGSLSALKIVARNTPPGGGSEQVVTVMNSYTLGDDIDWELRVVDGNGSLFLNGQLVRSFPANTSGCYFKAGSYAQSNVADIGESASEYAAVELRNFQHWHTGWPAAQPIPGGSTGGGTGGPSGAYGGSGALASSAIGGPITPALPTGLTTNDYLLTQIYSRYGETPNTPAGWTLLAFRVGTDSDFAGGLFIYGKKWESGDSAPTYQTSSADGGLYGRCSRFSGVNTTTPVGSNPVGSHGVSPPIVAPGYSSSAGAKVVHFVVQDNDYNLNNPTGGATLMYTHTANGGPDGTDGAAMAAAFETLSAAGSSGTCEFTTSGTANPQRWVGISLGLLPV